MRSNFPHEAIAIIDRVLQFGRATRKYPDAFWRTLSMSDHIDAANLHLKDFLYGTNPGEDHLAHALTRLAMAVSLRETEK